MEISRCLVEVEVCKELPKDMLVGSSVQVKRGRCIPAKDCRKVMKKAKKNKKMGGKKK